MATLPLALLGVLLILATPGTFVRALAATRLVPMPFILGLRRRDLSGPFRRADRLGLPGPMRAIVALAVAGSCAIAWQRPESTAVATTVWALVLAAICDRQSGTLPPFLTLIVGLGTAAALSIDQAAAGGNYGGTADLLFAAFIAGFVEAAVRLDARNSGRRILGEGDPPLFFALFAWAGPVGGSLAFVGALLLVLAGALVGGRTPGASPPFGVALAAATMPFVLMPAAARHIADLPVLWLVT